MNNKNHHQQHEKLKKFKIYYFTGDFWSGKGEHRKSTIILARSESEAKKIFKNQYSNRSFGWTEERD